MPSRFASWQFRSSISVTAPSLTAIPNSRAASSSSDPDAIWDSLAALAVDLVPADRIGLLSFDEESRMMSRRDLRGKGCPGFEDGQVLPVKYFGQELILYRTESGEARLTDAYCPHLGAHLGAGKVEGESLRCAFHGFEFGGDGRCVRTAYGKAVPRKAKLGTWPIREHNGYIFAWHHPEGQQPAWEVPVLPGPAEGWTAFRTRAIKVKSHPQETSENSVDTGHFVQVHGFGDAWTEGDLEVEGHLLKGAYGIQYPITGKLNLVMKFNVEVHGLGYSLVRVEMPRFNASVHALVMSSPVDQENIVLRTSVSMKQWGPRPVTHLVRELASLGLNKEVGQDAPIWETKRYVERPILAEGDGPIAEYRRYCKQFYVQPAAKTTQLPVVAA